MELGAYVLQWKQRGETQTTGVYVYNNVCTLPLHNVYACVYFNS